MIKIEIVKISTGEVVNTVEVKGAKTPHDFRVERTERGMMINMNLREYFTRIVDTSEVPKK